MFVIAVQAEKGGVGKTTTAVSLAYILAEEHKARVLLIDADQQGNASQLVQRYDPEHSGTVDVLEGNREITAAALPVTLKRFREDYYFDILTANGYLMNTNADILQDTVQDQVHRLRKALHAARGWYDYVVIDCGLLMDMAVLNAMVAADMWIVPMRPGGLEADAVANAEERLEELRRNGWKNCGSLTRICLPLACWWPQERAKSMRRYTSGSRVKRAWGRFQRSFHAVS